MNTRAPLIHSFDRVYKKKKKKIAYAAHVWFTRRGGGGEISLIKHRNRHEWEKRGGVEICIFFSHGPIFTTVLYRLYMYYRVGTIACFRKQLLVWNDNLEKSGGVWGGGCYVINEGNRKRWRNLIIFSVNHERERDGGGN